MFPYELHWKSILHFLTEIWNLDFRRRLFGVNFHSLKLLFFEWGSASVTIRVDFFQYLAIFDNENVPNSIIKFQTSFNILL